MKIFPVTWNGDSSTVTATSQQFAAVLASGETHQFVCNIDCWIQQGYNPTAVAADSAPLVVADDDIDSLVSATDIITMAAHGLLTGDGPLRLTTTDTLPGGLALATDYWVISEGTNTLRLAASFVEAMQGEAVDITSNGVGTHTFSDTASTRRAGCMFVPAAYPVLIDGGLGVTLAVLRDGGADGLASLTRCKVG